LHALRGRVDTQPGERHQDDRLSSRPGTGIDQYGPLRSVRAEGAGVGPPLSQAYAEAQSEAAAEAGDFDSELPGIGAYFNRLIAAARSSLSRADAAAGIRSLRTQKILAMRAAKDRRRAASANQPRRVHPGPTTARSNQQFG